jgi:hypothetical protein
VPCGTQPLSVEEFIFENERHGHTPNPQPFRTALQGGVKSNPPLCAGSSVNRILCELKGSTQHLR